jgi:hypothetical protein
MVRRRTALERDATAGRWLWACLVPFLYEPSCIWTAKLQVARLSACTRAMFGYRMHETWLLGDFVWLASYRHLLTLTEPLTCPIHALVALARAWPRRNEDFAAWVEPGSWGNPAPRGTGPNLHPSNQTLNSCIRGAWCQCMQVTKRPLYRRVGCKGRLQEHTSPHNKRRKIELWLMLYPSAGN